MVITWMDEAGGRAVHGVRTGTQRHQNVASEAMQWPSVQIRDQERFPTVRSSAGCYRKPETGHKKPFRQRPVSPEYSRLSAGCGPGRVFSQDDVDRAADFCLCWGLRCETAFWRRKGFRLQGSYGVTNLPCNRSWLRLFPKGQSLSGQDQDDTIIILHHGEKNAPLVQQKPALKLEIFGRKPR